MYLFSDKKVFVTVVGESVKTITDGTMNLVMKR